MMISATFLSVMVGSALVVTIAAPFILLFLFVRDWIKGVLW